MIMGKRQRGKATDAKSNRGPGWMEKWMMAETE